MSTNTTKSPAAPLRVFVTGAGGLLGCALLPYLRSLSHEVVAAPGRTSPRQTLDLLNEADVHGLLDSVRPDVIVNLAALTDVDYCELHPDEAYRVNAGLVLHLARWIESRHSAAHLVQISTDQLYDGPGPHVEATICPTNFYAYSKCVAEEYVGRVGGTSLRTNFFGHSSRPGRASFSDWIVASIRAERPITVFEDVLFSPLSLPTLVRAIDRVMREPARGVFNLGSRQGLSKADFAFRLAEAAGLPSTGLTRGTLASRPQAARRPRDMRMDSTLFARTFAGFDVDLNQEIEAVGRGYRNEAK